jgi:hypothetical protein
MLIGSMDKDPSDPSIHLRIIHLYEDGTVGATWWLDATADGGLQKFRSLQPAS